MESPERFDFNYHLQSIFTELRKADSNCVITLKDESRVDCKTILNSFDTCVEFVFGHVGSDNLLEEDKSDSHKFFIVMLLPYSEIQYVVYGRSSKSELWEPSQFKSEYYLKS